MPYLQFHLGSRALFAQPLRGGRLLVGRSDGCDVALPGEEISRVHAVFDERSDGWWVTDRSRHGTRVNGVPVERAQLFDGDVVQIGPFSARFWPSGAALGNRPTATAPLWQGQPEELVEVDPAGFTACRAVLEVVRGPRSGEVWTLRQSRLRVGGVGADVEIDAELPEDAVRLRVVRGRLMVEPGSVPAKLAGVPVRELTPALPGERIDLGAHGLVVRVEAQREERESGSFGEMVGGAPAMRKLFGVLSRMARHEFPVLLLGESGTGKELAARALHAESARAGGPFVAVNCAAIASTLFETELFGHEKGAFTGAEQARDGAFQRAADGVLFLDEIGELGLEEQAKLLRALESGEVRRVGAQEVSFPDVRVVAATNRDPASMVRAGAFRADLYHRLNALTVRLPALRERSEDIVLLAEALLARHHPDATLTDDARDALTAYHWPGNVRELKNVLTRAYVLGGAVIASEDLTFLPDSFAPTEQVDLGAMSLEEVERAQLLAALEQVGGNRTQAARALGIPRSSLLYKLKRLGVT